MNLKENIERRINQSWNKVYTIEIERVDMKVIEIKDKLVSEPSQCDKVEGIGQTGDINAELIPGRSDIDMFV